MLIGSMFSGLLGGLDIACERVFDAETAWQLDITGASVRRRHWPGVLQVEADVATVDPADLPRVDVLCGGFPCQDLSTAGKQAGLDGARSGLYRHVLRFARVIEPQYIVLENVSGLLPYMPRLVADFQALGYGLTYAVCEAADVGLPHLRRRVFVVAEAGVTGRGRVEVDTSRRWIAEEAGRMWPTVMAHADARSVIPTRWPGPDTYLNVEAAQCVSRTWGTPRVGNSGTGGDREDDRGRLEDQAQSRAWATVTTRGFKSGDLPTRVGTEALSAQAGAAVMGAWGRRLNPAWVETLMGLPQEWTLPTGPSLRDQLDDWRAPRGRYPKDWDRSVPWPGFDWEPARTLPDGPPCPGRPARIKGLGNGVVWQQAELGLNACVAGKPGLVLFYEGLCRLQA